MNQFNLKIKRTFQAQERQMLGFERHRGVQLHKEKNNYHYLQLKQEKVSMKQL